MAVQGRSNNLQVAVAGGALIGDNLGTALTAAGEDARYANLLFLLLGLPGLVLSAIVARLVVTLRSDRRRREIALLRLRGAPSVTSREFCPARQRPLPSSARSSECPSPCSPSTRTAGGYAALRRLDAGRAGRGVAARFRDPGRSRGPAGTRQRAARGCRRSLPTPAFRHALAAEGRAGHHLDRGRRRVVRLTARSGYQVVLAPEASPTQVNYAALVGPALACRARVAGVARDGLDDGPPYRTLGTWSLLGRTGTRAASLRQRRMIVARGAAGLAVALGLAASTAIFTATYDTQSRVDVALTVGSDVAVVEPPGAVVGPGAARQISGHPGSARSSP